ncbi:MAG: S8 family serine peptidase, partial [Acidobacteria bacterium]|nr:S8 family serine peptidase [Acidobacteriota bacterium]
LVARPSLLESMPIIRSAPLWQYGYTGIGWSVAILDTGVDSAHPFFGGRVVSQACFSSTDLDEDATSLCPDGVDSSIGPGSAEACPASIAGCDHGTHVAGIAAGSGGGGAGVARAASVVAIQVYSRFDSAAACSPDPSPCVLSYASDQIRALEHVLAIAQATSPNRIAAVNLSLTFPGVFAGACDTAAGMTVFKQAVDDLRALGIATVAASGNDGSTGGIGRPACVSSMVSVGSTADTVDMVSGFSNCSPQLSLLAPGGNITSSVPGGGFSVKSGTSMAAPHVAGAWALLKQLVPGASVSTILGALRGTGVTVTDSFRSYPRIVLDRAALALNGGVPPPPSPPLNPSVLTNGNFVTLQWEAPMTGGAISEYLVLVGTEPGVADAGTFSAGTAQAISATVATGTYFVRVAARTGAGQGSPSAEVSFTVLPPPPPNAPASATANVAGSRVTLSWQAPNTGAMPTTYRLEAGSAPGLANLAVFDTTTPVTTIVVDGVPPGVYYVRIRARTAAGTSSPSTELVVTVN